MDEEQKYFTEISDRIDELDERNQMFILWYLLRSYGKFVGLEEELAKEPTSKYEYAAQQMAINHKRTVGEMRDCLVYTIW